LTEILDLFPEVEQEVESVDKIVDKNTQIIIERFVTFFEKMIELIPQHMPHVLRILLQTVYNNSQKLFTIEKDNYSPLYTMLFFNFFISPRVLEFYNINIVKNHSVKCINRIIRVILKY
jgi:hypothetical protein